MVPTLPNLKYLGLSFKDDEALMQLALFLKASPYLQRLVIHVSIQFYLVDYSNLVLLLCGVILFMGFMMVL